MSFISQRPVFGQTQVRGKKRTHYFMYLFVALFEDLFYSFVLNHYSHSLILCKLIDLKNQCWDMTLHC